MTQDGATAEDQGLAVIADDDRIDNTPFDYNALEMETRIVVQQRTRDIKERMKRTAQDIIDTGRDLAEVRSKLSYGQFGAWLATEFAWSRSTAYNLIRVHEQLGSANFAQLPVAASALYLLAAPSTPVAAREEALARASGGEAISRGAAREIVTSHKPAPTTSRSGGGGGGGGGGGSSAGSGVAQTPPASMAPKAASAAPAEEPSQPVAARAASAVPSGQVGSAEGEEEIAALPTTAPTVQATPPAPVQDERDEDTEEVAALPTATPTAQPAQATPLPVSAVASPTLTPLPAAPLPAAPVSMLGAVANGVQAQQIRLLVALDLLLREAQQLVQRQLAELRGAGANVPVSTANPDLLRQSARQLVESPTLRTAGAMLALSLRGMQDERQVSDAA
jgi:hypothetical protein